jgi:anti-sigma B factor antagonist
MAVELKVIDDVIIVDVDGNLTGGRETDECHMKVKTLIANGYKHLVLDLSNVKRINSLGLGMLMACYSLYINAGGKMKIAGVSEKVNSILVMTNLITIFEQYQNIDLALKSFQ